MYTRCPHCGTVFGVDQAQLDLANGRVRCGQCLTPFQALENILETLPAGAPAGDWPPTADLNGRSALPVAPTDAGQGGSRGTSTDDQSGGAYPGWYHFDGIPADGWLEAADIGESLRTTLAENLNLQPTAAETVSSPEVAPGPSERADSLAPSAWNLFEPLPEPDSEAATVPGADVSAGRASGTAMVEEAPDTAVPEVLLEESSQSRPRPASRPLRLLQAATVVILLAALGLQYAWFRPAEILRHMPQAQPWLARLFATAGRPPPVLRDLSLIRLVRRDVRSHPLYAGALLVDATLMNTAPYAQPFPVIQFTLFDVSGATIASRAFAPSEYLDQDTAAVPDMATGVPVQIRLDLVAPEAGAVSYEFQFR